MAIRDMDIAAEIIGIRPMNAKLSAFAVSSFFIGVAGALYFGLSRRGGAAGAFDIRVSFLVLFMIIIGGLGSILGSVPRGGVHGADADPAEQGAGDGGRPLADRTGRRTWSS